MFNKGVNFNFPDNNEGSITSELLNIEQAIKTLKIDELKDITGALMQIRLNNNKTRIFSSQISN